MSASLVAMASDILIPVSQSNRRRRQSLSFSAAIWWRVSIEDQGETSPDTRIKETLALAEEEG